MNKITSRIYIGNWWNSIDERQLLDNNIKCILCINERYKKSTSIKLYKKLNIKHKHIFERDVPNTNLLKHFVDTNGFIYDCVNNGQNILIHCTCGISRASTIVIAYLLFDFYFKQHLAKKQKGAGWLPIQIKNNNSVLEEIIQYVKSKRTIINPNPGFINQLITYEYMLYTKNNSY